MNRPEFRIGIFGGDRRAAAAVRAPLDLGAFEVAAEGRCGSDPSACTRFGARLFTVMSFLTTTGFVSEHTGRGAGMVGAAHAGVGADGAGPDRRRRGHNGGRCEAAAGLCPLPQRQARDGPAGASLIRQRGGGGRAGGCKATGLSSLGSSSCSLPCHWLAVTLLLTLAGASFDAALVLSVATLSTTGPLIEHAADTPIHLIELGPDGQSPSLAVRWCWGGWKPLRLSRF